MTFIRHIINSYFKYIEENHLKTKIPLFCLDNYSFIYDKENKLEDIEMCSKTTRKYHLYIIYSIIDQEDQKCFMINSNHMIYKPCLYPSDFPCFYISSFRNLSEFETRFKKDNIQIPSIYNNIFGENIFFLFKFIKEGIKFEDFVEKEKNEISKEIEDFYCKSTNKKYMIQKLIDIINNKTEIEFDKEFFINISLGYIIIDKINNKYSFKYSFPLIKIIIENLVNRTFFIDINNPQFLELSDAAKSINFDEFMNDYFKKENSFFGYKSNEIEKAMDEYCLEKNSLNDKGEQIYKFIDVLDLLEENKSKSKILSKLIEEYKNKDLIKNKKLIVVFQKFNGKFVDILFLVKKENNNIVNNDYSIVNLQIKLSDHFKITKQDKKLEPFQMTYLKEKYQYIFGINIIDAYIIYLAFYEYRKNFDINNEKICIFYSKEKYKLVDFKGNVLDKFPFLKKSKVELISKINELIYPFKKLLQNITKKKLIITKTDKNIYENMMKIEISKEIITLKITFMGIEITETMQNNEKFKEAIIYYEIDEDEEI